MNSHFILQQIQNWRRQLKQKEHNSLTQPHATNIINSDV